jgi:hypothetical protein
MRNPSQVHFSVRALSWAAQLVRVYIDNADQTVADQVRATLAEVGDDEAAVRDLIGSLAGLAGQALTVAADALQSVHGEPGGEHERGQEQLSAQRANLLLACAESLRQPRNTPLRLHPANKQPSREPRAERRSGIDRRLAIDRRHRSPGSPAEKINIRLYGERRALVVDRRSGLDRRRDREQTG